LKKVAAILLLSVHLFYAGGYSFVFQYFIHEADVQMVKEMYANKIDDTKLILLKIPVNMPTVTDWSEYEVIAGQIQLKDAYYNYVRLKMTHDTMYLICRANKNKTLLEKANIITANQINDVPLSKKSDPLAKKANVLSEYYITSFYLDHRITELILPPGYQTVIAKVNSPYIDSPGKPPNCLA
jgi:hypothetical protein